MNIKFSDLLKKIEYIALDKEYELNLEENSIFLGANGIGKTTIYNALKEVNKNSDYLDYEKTRNSFIDYKRSITIKIDNKELTEIKEQIEGLLEEISIKKFAKKIGIITQKAASSFSSLLKNKLNDYFNKLVFTDEDLNSLSSVNDYSDFILNNYESLKNLADISDDLSRMEDFLLNKTLVELLRHIDSNCKICPVCNTSVLNLREILCKKIEQLGEARNEIIKKFIICRPKNSNNSVKEINKILKVVKEIDEEKILHYKLTNGDKMTINQINNDIDILENLNLRKENIQNKNESLYINLVKNKTIFLKYLEDNFHAKVHFDNEKKEVTITLERNVVTYSTAEINVILMVTMLFNSFGNDKESIIIDDPISSYDLINQYHIVYHLCKMTSNKKIIIFTHNPDVINIINAQRKNVFKYFVMDKIFNKLVINEIPKNISAKDNILSISCLLEKEPKKFNLIDKHLYLLTFRNSEDKGEISKLLHYDGNEEIYCGKLSFLSECSNTFFIDFIENISLNDVDIQNDFIKLSKYKILALTSLRVWLEKNLILETNEDKKNKKPKLGFKLNRFCEHYDLGEEHKSFLMSRKVMLNQNCHPDSQVMPFYYALSLKFDDLIKEISELKKQFSNFHNKST